MILTISANYYNNSMTNTATSTINNFIITDLVFELSNKCTIKIKSDAIGSLNRNDIMMGMNQYISESICNYRNETTQIGYNIAQSCAKHYDNPTIITYDSLPQTHQETRKTYSVQQPHQTRNTYQPQQPSTKASVSPYAVQLRPNCIIELHQVLTAENKQNFCEGISMQTQSYNSSWNTFTKAGYILATKHNECQYHTKQTFSYNISEENNDLKIIDNNAMVINNHRSNKQGSSHNNNWSKNNYIAQQTSDLYSINNSSHNNNCSHIPHNFVSSKNNHTSTKSDQDYLNFDSMINHSKSNVGFDSMNNSMNANSKIGFNSMNANSDQKSLTDSTLDSTAPSSCNEESMLTSHMIDNAAPIDYPESILQQNTLCSYYNSFLFVIGSFIEIIS